MLNLVGQNGTGEWEYICTCEPNDVHLYQAMLTNALTYFERIRVLDDNMNVIVEHPTVH